MPVDDRQLEAGVSHRRFQQRVGGQARWVQRQIRVGGERSDREVAFASVQVDGLGAGDNERAGLLVQRGERVEQHASRGYVAGVE